MPQRATSSYLMENGLKLENLQGERWKEIDGTNGRYLISNKGRLKTTNWKNSGRTMIMNPAINKNGYLHTVILLKGKLKAIKLHSVVALAFIENPQNKPQINHKDFNTRNNSVENLEWVTAKENFQHSNRANHQKSF